MELISFPFMPTEAKGNGSPVERSVTFPDIVMFWAEEVSQQKQRASATNSLMTISIRYEDG